MDLAKLLIPGAILGWLLFNNKSANVTPTGGNYPAGTSPPPLPTSGTATTGTNPATAKWLADTVVNHLNSVKKYKENKSLISQYQAAVGGLKVDGMYGPKTAITIAALGIVPPKPFYWDSKTSAADKSNYQAQIAQYAANDPLRAAQWTAAASNL